MKIYLRLGGIIFCLDSERPVQASEFLSNFYVTPQEANVTACFHWDWTHAKRPKSKPVGSDLLQVFFQEEDNCFCELGGEDVNAVSCVCYKKDFSEIVCAINEVTCRALQDTEAQLLQMLPMRGILLRFGILFFHASQIAYQGRGILFTAPSGTGKSTQAKLWRQYQGAEIICNDRTLVRNVDGVWRTYGYPLDGSEPVKSSAVHRLGAVVLLEQGRENTVKRLRPSKALPRLMEQLVLDCWNSEARTAALDLLIKLMEQIPVYLLCCTPDEQAVETLKEQLMEDEVIPRG